MNLTKMPSFSGQMGINLLKASTVTAQQADKMNAQIAQTDNEDIEKAEASLRKLQHAEQALGRFIAEKKNPPVSLFGVASVGGEAMKEAVGKLFKLAEAVNMVDYGSVKVYKAGSLHQDSIDLPGSNIRAWNEDAGLVVTLNNPSKPELDARRAMGEHGKSPEYRIFLQKDGVIKTQRKETPEIIQNIAQRLVELGERATDKRCIEPVGHNSMAKGISGIGFTGHKASMNFDQAVKKLFSAAAAPEVKYCLDVTNPAAKGLVDNNVDTIDKPGSNVNTWEGDVLSLKLSTPSQKEVANDEKEMGLFFRDYQVTLFKDGEIETPFSGNPKAMEAIKERIVELAQRLEQAELVSKDYENLSSEDSSGDQPFFFIPKGL